MANNLNFVSFDYQSHRQALLNRVRSRWSGSWNDFVASSFGILIVDLIAWTTASIAYVINRLAAENFISTMTLRESAVRIGQLFSYNLDNPKPASVMCEVQLATPVTPAQQQITIHAGTSFTSAGLVFQLAQEAFISQGSTTPITPIITIAANQSGAGVLQSYFIGTQGSNALILADDTVDLTAYVSIGQKLQSLANTAITYTIEDIQPASGSVENNTLILDIPWATVAGSGSENVAAQVSEDRLNFVQSQSITETFTTPTTETPGYTYILNQTPVIDGSVTVTVSTEIWPVGDLTKADSAAQVVSATTTINGTTAIIFGDGVLGAMAPTDALVTVAYSIGGGSAGNIAINSVNASIVGADISGLPVQIAVTNLLASGIGGVDQESLSDARAALPAFIKANGRGVTLSDYTALASGYSDPLYGSVTYAQAATSTGNNLLEGNIISLYAWTTGPTGGLVPLSSNLKASLLNYLQTVAVGTGFVTVSDGASTPVPIALRYKVLPGYDIASVGAAITSAINTYVNANTPGQAIVLSNLIETVDQLTGVDSLTMATPTTDIQPADSATVYTIPSSTNRYTIQLATLYGYTSQGQCPVNPLQAWCVTATLGTSQLTVLPDTIPGRARLIGPGLADYEIGLSAAMPAPSVANTNAFYFATDSQTIFQSNGNTWTPVTVGGSYIDLLTGQVVISTTGQVGDFSISLITAQGYSREKNIDIYASYVGDISFKKRQDIRAALRSWAGGLSIGSSLFTQAQRGMNGSINLDISRSNVTDVILSVPGVAGVNASIVAFNSLNNLSPRLNCSEVELPKIGTVYLNGLQS